MADQEASDLEKVHGGDDQWIYGGDGCFGLCWGAGSAGLGPIVG